MRGGGERKVKNSIARKVTRRVSIILLIAMVVLFVTSYLLVQYIVMENARTQNKAMLTIYADRVEEVAFMYQIRIDESSYEILISEGNYISELYNIEYAYLFVPDIDAGTIKYVCFSQSGQVDEMDEEKRLVGRVVEYELTDEEKAVWLGEQEISNSVTKSRTGREISTMTRIEDPYGNFVMAGVDQSYEEVTREIRKLFSVLALVIIVVAAAGYLMVYYVIRRKITEPAQKVCRTMNEFLKDGSRSQVALEVKGNDEFAMISSAFNSMTADINEYIDNIGRLNRKQAEQDAQLDISSRIQRGFLKGGFFENDNCTILANMIPAKDVAGDLYDYLQLDDHRVLTVIADVSGKGIGASLFMAVTLMLIREFAKMGMTPAEILKRVNDILSENNPSMLFTTAIVGIYDCHERNYTYANAGHNLPYVINAHITELNEAQNVLLGIFPGEEFKEHRIKLEIGDTLFLYTDGVSEAINERREFFGTARLEAALKEYTGMKSDNLIEFVTRKMETFAGQAERHDDTTMLCFIPSEAEEIVLKPQISEFRKIREKILSLSISRQTKMDLCLAAEEVFDNICCYAYADDTEKGLVQFYIKCSDRIRIRFIDQGIPFDPTKNVQKAEDYDMENQIGGLGRLIAYDKVDDVKYEYKDGKNVLMLTKYKLDGGK